MSWDREDTMETFWEDHAARRAGFTYAGLLRAAKYKLGINKGRQWGKPNDDGSVEHIRQ